MNKLVTVFTPLYNRKDLLPRLYESLREQTCFSFEWVICDDCSSDGSYELAREMAGKEDRFPIRVFRAERNGGKHRAVNLGAAQARGFLFFIVDSDDLLTPDAIGKILAWEETIRCDQGFAGLGFLKADLSAKLVGTTFPEQTCDCTTLEREAHQISGDKAEVFYTAVIQKYPYPEFEGERYMTPPVAWDQIAHAGLAGLAARRLESLVPLAAVGAEDQHHFRLGDEGLIVAGFDQLLFDGLIGDVQNGVQLLVACGGRVDRRRQDGLSGFRRDGRILKHPHGFAGNQLTDDFIHHASSFGFRSHSR